MIRTIAVPVLACATLAGVLSMSARADEPRRYPLPADAMHAENGFCYIAGMDFGEEGDKFTSNGSQLLVFEDGRPLGPAHSVHADIRDQGEGRYSHWTREGLYFSASDNTDPRTNGREYRVVYPWRGD